MLNPGTMLQNRYRIVSMLGQGGMGAVYRAWDTRLNIPVALKEMTPQPGLDPNMLTQLRQQFQQEAAVLARLSHPHLVHVTDFFAEWGNTYLVMDFVEGENLADRIMRQGPLSEAQVLAWANQLLDALAYCHSQGVLHRDVKPQNVIIRPNGQAILVDFGLVKLWDPHDPRTKTAMRGMGTPEYAPPEQYDVAAGHTDPRSDVYSLGATIYHALTGQAPPTATMRIVEPGTLMPLRVLVAGVSAGTEAAITRAMELQPANRFQSTEEMQAALSGRAPTPARVATPKRQPTEVMPGAQPAVSARRRRMPKWAWALGGLVVIGMLTLLIAAGLIALLSSRTPLIPLFATDTPTSTPRPTRTPRPTATRTPTPTPTVDIFSATILVYGDGDADDPEDVHLFEALDALGLDYVQHDDAQDFMDDLTTAGYWTMIVVSQMDNDNMGDRWDDIESFLHANPTVAIIETWNADDEDMAEFLDYCGVYWEADIADSQPIFWHAPTHPLFTFPNDVPEFEQMSDLWVDDGDELTAVSGATLLGGLEPGDDTSGVIALCRDQRTLINTFLFGNNEEDLDGDGTLDSIELWMNEIDYMLRRALAGEFPTPAPVPTRTPTPSTLRILAWTTYVDMDEEYQHVLDALSSLAPSAYEVTETETTGASTLSSALEGYHVFLIPEQEDADNDTLAEIGSSFGPVLEEFVRQGGRVVSVGERESHGGILKAMGLLDASFTAYIHPGTVSIVDRDSPVAQGLPDSFDTENATDSYTIADVDATIVAESADGDAVVATRSIGLGHVILIGYDYYESSPNAGRLVVNAIFWPR